MIGSQKVFDYRWIINPYKVDTAQKVLGSNLNPDASPIFQDLVKRCFKTGRLANSAAYTDFILDQYIMDSCYLVHQKIDVKKCYMYLKQYFMGWLRERLVTQMAYRFRREEGDLAFCINDALSFTKNADFRTVLTNLKSSRIKGAPAYDFALQDTSGRKVSLSQLKGKVVILDFWFTGCGGCREIAPLLREMEAEYSSNDNVVFVSICIDKQKAKWMSSIHGGLYTSKDCLNLSTGPLGIEHPVIQRYKVGSYPTLIFIDRQGRLGENCADLRMDHGLSLKRMIQAQIK